MLLACQVDMSDDAPPMERKLIINHLEQETAVKGEMGKDHRLRAASTAAAAG